MTPPGASAPPVGGPPRSGPTRASLRVPTDLAPLVFQRAAEIDGGDDGSQSSLDEAALLEIAAEVGLSGAAVRQALVELHAGALGPVALGPVPADRGALVGPRTLVVDRLVPGPPDAVEHRLHEFLDGQCLDRRRRHEGYSLWLPREGLVAGLQRRLSRRRRLADVTRLELRVRAVPGTGAGTVHVVVEADLGTVRRSLTGAAASGLVAGGGGVTIAAAAALSGEPFALLGVLPSAAASAAVWAGTRSTYRRTLAGVELVLQGFLDEL